MKKIYFLALALICTFLANAADIKICVKQNDTFNDSNIGTLNFYYWNASSASASWPGQAFSSSQKTTVNGVSFYYHTVTIGSGDWGMIFNINGDDNKTGDIKGPKEDTYYEITLDDKGKLAVNPAFVNENASGYFIYGNELNNWSKSTEYELLKTGTDKVYELKNVKLSGYFKIGTADWSESFGPADNSTMVKIGEATTLVNSSESKNLFLDNTYNATVTLDMTGENPVITITGEKTASGVYLKGEVNGWSDNADWQFTSLGAGVYELEKTMLASDGKFKITANGAWYGAESTSFGGPFEVSTSGNDMALPENSIVSKFTFTIAEDGKSTLSITEGVLDNNLYLRGNVTNWKVNDAYKFTETETAGIYTLENVKLQGYFKIADSLWKNYNIGGKDDGFVEVGEDVIVANSNTSVNFYLDGTYQCSLITLDLTGEEPVLTIEGETTNSGIFLYGAFNEWGAADDMADWEFIDNGEGIYTLEKEVLASDGAFCININGENAGTSTAQVIIYGDTYTLDGKQNMTLPVSTRTESFELLISDENAAYLTVNMGEEPSGPEQDPSAVEQINASSNASAEYFNLQGVKVSTDKLSNGIYIKKQGSKTTKVIL